MLESSQSKLLKVGNIGVYTLTKKKDIDKGETNMIHQGEREARIKTYSNDYQREATKNIICFNIRGGHWHQRWRF